MYGVLYQLKAWKEKDELNISPYLTYAEARDEGKYYYPEGFDIEEIYLDELEEM